MRRQHEHVYTWRSAPDSNRHTPFAKKEKKTTTSGNDKKQTSEFKHVILEHEQEIICIEDEQKKKKVWHHLVTAPYVTSTLWHWLCVHSDLWIAPSLAHGKKNESFYWNVESYFERNLISIATYETILMNRRVRPENLTRNLILRRRNTYFWQNMTIGFISDNVLMKEKFAWEKAKVGSLTKNKNSDIVWGTYWNLYICACAEETAICSICLLLV